MYAVLCWKRHTPWFSYAACMRRAPMLQRGAMMAQYALMCAELVRDVLSRADRHAQVCSHEGESRGKQTKAPENQAAAKQLHAPCASSRCSWPPCWSRRTSLQR